MTHLKYVIYRRAIQGDDDTNRFDPFTVAAQKLQRVKQ